jgi:hypothetical protein
MIGGENQVASGPVLICPTLTDATGRYHFGFDERLADRSLVGVDESRVLAKNGHHGYRLRRREREVVEAPPLRKNLSVRGLAIRASAYPQEIAALGIDPLPDGFEIIGLYRSS